MKPVSAHVGFVFLIGVLSVGVVATMFALSLLLRGWALEQNGALVGRANQAFEYASGCVERSIRDLRLDPAFNGSGVTIFPGGSCTVRTIGGAGNWNRDVCVEGRSGGIVKKMQVSVAQLYPSVRIASWEEVATFTLCP